jgi:hypothetical protein
MNLITLPVVLAKTFVEVAIGAAAALSFSRTGS